MNNKKVKALLMDKELEGRHNVSCKNTEKKNQVEVCWSNALGGGGVVEYKKKKRYIPNTQEEIVSQQTGILAKGNEDTPCGNHSK